MINRIERPLANDHPDGSFSVHLFLHRPKTQNLRIIGQYTHNLLGLKTLSFALLLFIHKIWIKGPQIGSDMPSALGLVLKTLFFFNWSKHTKSYHQNLIHRHPQLQLDLFTEHQMPMLYMLPVGFLKNVLSQRVTLPQKDKFCVVLKLENGQGLLGWHISNIPHICHG